SQSIVLARSPRAATTTWLVLADRQGVGERVAAPIRARGESCRVAWASGAEGGVDPERPEEFRRLVGELAGGGAHGASVRVLHLWALDGDDGSLDALD